MQFLASIGRPSLANLLMRSLIVALVNESTNTLLKSLTSPRKSFFTFVVLPVPGPAKSIFFTPEIYNNSTYKNRKPLTKRADERVSAVSGRSWRKLGATASVMLPLRMLFLPRDLRVNFELVVVGAEELDHFARKGRIHSHTRLVVAETMTASAASA